MRQTFKRLSQITEEKVLNKDKFKPFAYFLGIGFATGFTLTTYENGKEALLYRRDKLKNVSFYSEDYKRAAEIPSVFEGCIMGLPLSILGGLAFPIVIVQHAVLFLNEPKD